MSRLRVVLGVVDSLSDWTGKGVCFLVIGMMLVLAWAAISRYLLNSPVSWAQELTGFFYGAYFIIGGAYTLRWGAHVNVDILQSRLSLRKRAIVELFTWMFFFLYCGVLLWRSEQAAWIAVVRNEHSVVSDWGPPLWPIKLFIPVGAALILLQGLARYIRQVYTAVGGHEPIASTHHEVV